MRRALRARSLSLTAAIVVLVLVMPVYAWLDPGVSTVAGVMSSLAATAACQAEGLAGTWKVRSMTFDGKPGSDPELVGATMTFTAGRLAMTPAQGARAEFAIEIDDATTPCALHLTPIGSSAEPDGWMLFSVGQDALTLGFHDNLGRRALTFESRPDMIVLTLVRQAPPH